MRKHQSLAIAAVIAYARCVLGRWIQAACRADSDVAHRDLPGSDRHVGAGVQPERGEDPAPASRERVEQPGVRDARRRRKRAPLRGGADGPDPRLRAIGQGSRDVPRHRRARPERRRARPARACVPSGLRVQRAVLRLLLRQRGRQRRFRVQAPLGRRRQTRVPSARSCGWTIRSRTTTAAGSPSAPTASSTSRPATAAAAATRRRTARASGRCSARSCAST